MQNAKCRTDAAEREQRVLAHYAESQGGKALFEGLMQNAELTQRNESRGCLHTMPSRKEEKPSKRG